MEWNCTRGLPSDRLRQGYLGIGLHGSSFLYGRLLQLHLDDAYSVPSGLPLHFLQPQRHVQTCLCFLGSHFGQRFDRSGKLVEGTIRYAVILHSAFAVPIDQYANRSLPTMAVSVVRRLSRLAFRRPCPLRLEDGQLGVVLLPPSRGRDLADPVAPGISPSILDLLLVGSRGPPRVSARISSTPLPPPGNLGAGSTGLGFDMSRTGITVSNRPTSFLSMLATIVAITGSSVGILGERDFRRLPEIDFHKSAPRVRSRSIPEARWLPPSCSCRPIRTANGLGCSTMRRHRYNRMRVKSEMNVAHSWSYR